MVGKYCRWNLLSIDIGGISGINITPGEIQNRDITGLFQLIPSQYHDAVLSAYNSSIRLCFLVAIIFACLSVLGSLGMEWRNVKQEGGKQEIKEDSKEETKEETKEEERDTRISESVELQYTEQPVWKPVELEQRGLDSFAVFISSPPFFSVIL